MKQYTVDKDLKGDLLLGETKFKPGAIVSDRGNNPKLTRAIARCLKLKNSPIKVVEPKSEPKAENKLMEQQKEAKEETKGGNK